MPVPPERLPRLSELDSALPMGKDGCIGGAWDETQRFLHRSVTITDCESREEAPY